MIVAIVGFTLNMPITYRSDPNGATLYRRTGPMSSPEVRTGRRALAQCGAVDATSDRPSHEAATFSCYP
jgi:hypothetical protein